MFLLCSVLVHVLLTLKKADELCTDACGQQIENMIVYAVGEIQNPKFKRTSDKNVWVSSKLPVFHLDLNIIYRNNQTLEIISGDVFSLTFACLKLKASNRFPIH